MTSPDEQRASASRPPGVGQDSTAFIARLSGPREHGDKYRLVDEIARGGMGIIQKIWDGDLQRYLAKKVILARTGGEEAEVDPVMLARFLEEAQISGQLEHPGIVPVHEVGVDEEGHVFFTMQLVKGRELTEIFELVRREREGWSTTRALGVILKVCEAMAYAHDKGVIHRDLKPANVMVGRFGEVYVMDWGLAHVLGDRSKRKSNRSSTTMLTLDYAREQADGAGDSMRTMDGDVIGTPTYMSPQQARGRISELDVRGDVYSVGAILYSLLAGRAPYVEPGTQRGAVAVLTDLLSGPPKPVLEIAPDVPGELVAICEKAMARDLKDRYRNMQELADDLRAFLENRVVQAFETGAVAELKKWVARNRGLAAALVATVVLALGGLGAVVFVEARGRRAADAQRAIALENEVQAKKNEAEANRNAERARLERANVLRLSAFQKLEDLQAEAEELWPVVPARIPDFESWLERAREVVAGLEPDAAGEDRGHYAQLEELRSRALPIDESVDEEHPRHGELAALRAELRALEVAIRTSRGGVGLPPHLVDEEDRARTGEDLNQLAWELVGPNRTIFGREAEGLALARLGLARATTTLERAERGDTLAWALLRCGRDEEALEASRECVELVPPEEKAKYRSYLRLIEKALEERRGEAGQRRIEALEDSIAELEETIEDDRPWRFSSDDDRWWHSQLAKLVAEIEAFGDPETGLVDGTSARFGWGVARRLEFARQVEYRTLTGEAARRAWDEAIQSVGDPSSCPMYGGLELEPQLGLLPVGRDPDSGCWEFAHALTGSIPDRDASGRLIVDEDACVILVLVPGGTFSMGAQAIQPDQSNYAADAEEAESPVHEVELGPFFMSKYELTQGQWQRVTGSKPSRYYAGLTGLGDAIDQRHPVERISWDDCSLWLERMGLAIPTEAQWEYATRAGTTTTWWTGSERDSLTGACNLADQAASRVNAPWTAIADWPELDDGYPVHAPVGSYRANAFGLHDVHGNVREWCSDKRGPYTGPVAPGDGARIEADENNRIFRGGGFSSSADRARSAKRGVYTSELLFNDLGVRPARRLE